jgi:hypothetical protein
MAGAVPISKATAVVMRKRFIENSFLTTNPIGTSDETTIWAGYRSVIETNFSEDGKVS